jgi:hypothetical protein
MPRKKLIDKKNVVVGNEVYWNDPDNDFSSGIYKIVNCPPQKMLRSDSVIVLE